jgi:hypothetical protein
MFFSEEKNQKTFISWLLPPVRPWPQSFRERRNKSLLLLFFRKEAFFLLCLPKKKRKDVAIPPFPCSLF